MNSCVNGPQALYFLTIGSTKCNSGINLSSANKNLLIMLLALFIFITRVYQNKIFNPGIFDKGVLIPKDDEIPFASCFFTNLDFLFPQIEQFATRHFLF